MQNESEISALHLKRPSRRPTRFIVLVVGGLLSSTAVYSAAPEDNSAVEFRHAYESAVANAKDNDTLDPAYELLGVAGNARERNVKDMTESAAATFADLVQRATASALRKGGSIVQDTLDQLVDLRFFAETTQIDKAVVTLDGAMHQLFPVALKNIERHVDTSPNWDEKLSALRDLTSLESSATQVMMPDIATPISSAFDSHIATLEAKANSQTDTAERARELSDIAELKRARTEQINDATANNVSAVAKQMQSSGRTFTSSGGLHSEAEGELSTEMSEAEGSCIETGYRAEKNAADIRRAHDRDCVNSGRVPIKGRCSVTNISMVCYSRIPDGEKITYVYAGTTAESYFRKACADADRVSADKVPPNGASFRDAGTKFAFTCAPAGSDQSGD